MTNNGTAISKIENQDISTQLKEKLDKLLNFEEISQNYEQFKENLRDKQNYYLNYFYYFVGEHYESIINNVNFFHYGTESIILEKFRSNKDKEIDHNTDLEMLKNLTIDENSYFQNLKILTGSPHLYEATIKLSELQLAKMFLDKFLLFKDQVDYEKTNDFYTTFSRISCMAVSSTLKNLTNTNIDDELLFYKAFEETNKSNPTLINFIKSIERINPGMNLMKDKATMNLVKVYYFFAKSKYDDFLLDIELFLDHSTDLFEKVKKTAEKNTKKFNQNIKTAITYNKLKLFYETVSNKLTSSTDIIKSKLFSWRIWINESIKDSPTFFYDRYNHSKLFIYDKILSLSKDFMVLYTDKSVTFIMTNINNVQQSMKQVTSFFLDRMDMFADSVEKNVNDKDLFIRFSSDETVNYIKVDIDNTRLMINPTMFKEYVKNMYDQFMVQGKEFYEKSRNFIMEKYKLFLDKDEKNLN